MWPEGEAAVKAEGSHRPFSEHVSGTGHVPGFLGYPVHVGVFKSFNPPHISFPNFLLPSFLVLVCPLLTMTINLCPMLLWLILLPLCVFHKHHLALGIFPIRQNTGKPWFFKELLIGWNPQPQFFENKVYVAPSEISKLHQECKCHGHSYCWSGTGDNKQGTYMPQHSFTATQQLVSSLSFPLVMVYFWEDARVLKKLTLTNFASLLAAFMEK